MPDLEARLMRAWQAAALAVIAVAAAAGLYVLCWQPYACNRMKGAVEPQLVRIANLPQNIELTVRARGYAEQIDHCLADQPHDVELLMERAVCDLIAGNQAAAIPRYQQALRIDRRPEIYLDLGLAQYALGRRAEAVGSLGRAYAFATFFVNYDLSRPWSGERLLDQTPPELEKEIEAEAARVKAALAAH
jgi:tetratricopeptide (TPR) repeat protein